MAAAAISKTPENLVRALTTFFPCSSSHQLTAEVFLKSLNKLQYTNPRVLSFSNKSLVVKVNNSNISQETILKIHNIALEKITCERTNTKKLYEIARNFVPEIINTDPEISFVENLDGLGIRNCTEMEFVGEDLFDSFLDLERPFMNLSQLSSFTAQFMAFWKIVTDNGQIPTDIKPENITVKSSTPNDVNIRFIDHEVVLKPGKLDLRSKEIFKTIGYFSPAYAASKIDATYLSFPLGVILYTLITKEYLFPIHRKEHAALFRNLKERNDSYDRIYLYMVFQLIGQPDENFFNGGENHKRFNFQKIDDHYSIQLTSKEYQCIDDEKSMKNEETLTNKLKIILEDEFHPLYTDVDVEEKAAALKDIIMSLLRAKDKTSPSTLLPQLEKFFPDIRSLYTSHLG